MASDLPLEPVLSFPQVPGGGGQARCGRSPAQTGPPRLGRLGQGTLTNTVTSDEKGTVNQPLYKVALETHHSPLWESSRSEGFYLKRGRLLILQSNQSAIPASPR